MLFLSFFSLRCDSCTFSSQNKHDVVIHVSKEHQNEKRFSCGLCPYKSLRKYDLIKHLTGTHATDKPFTCPHCSYATSRSGDLRIHIKGKHKSKGYPFQCPHCNYKSSRKGDLEIHIGGRHNRDLPYKCRFCHFMTPWKSEIQTHIKRHHRQITGNNNENGNGNLIISTGVNDCDPSAIAALSAVDIFVGDNGPSYPTETYDIQTTAIPDDALIVLATCSLEEQIT